MPRLVAWRQLKLSACVHALAAIAVGQQSSTSSGSCDQSLVGAALSVEHAEAIRHAVAKGGGGVVVLTASDDVGATCHMENWFVHASAVAAEQGFPLVVHVGLDAGAHARCLAARDLLVAATLRLECVSIEGWLDVAKVRGGKAAALGHGSCFYQMVVWLKPRLLEAALASAVRGVFWLDADALPFADLSVWVEKHWDTLGKHEIACQAIWTEPYQGGRSSADIRCNAGVLFVPPGNRERLFEKWFSISTLDKLAAQAGGPVKGNIKIWGDQHALQYLVNMGRVDAWNMPVPAVAFKAQRTWESVVVHYAVPGNAWNVLDDRVKLGDMVPSGVWKPYSEGCKDVAALMRRAWAGHAGDAPGLYVQQHPRGPACVRAMRRAPYFAAGTGAKGGSDRALVNQLGRQALAFGYNASELFADHMAGVLTNIQGPIGVESACQHMLMHHDEL